MLKTFETGETYTELPQPPEGYYFVFEDYPDKFKGELLYYKRSKRLWREEITLIDSFPILYGSSRGAKNCTPELVRELVRKLVARAAKILLNANHPEPSETYRWPRD